MTILSFKELCELSISKNKCIYEIAQEEEAKLQEKEISEIRNSVAINLSAMKSAIKNGLHSSEKSISGWCGDDCEKLQQRYKQKHALFGTLFERITTYALTVSSDNSNC